MTDAVPPDALPFVSKAEAASGRFFDLRGEVAQWAFRNRSEISCLHGPVGCGKTIVWLEVLNACALKYPGMRGAIMRKYRRWLTSAALVSFENKVLTGRELIPDRIQPANRSAYRYHNGSVIDVVGLDDPQNVMSSEYDLIYLQEATECSWSTIEDINGRLRYGRMPYQRLLLDCNPKGPKHAIKKAMDAGTVEGRAMRHRDNPWIYNPDGTLTKNGEAYLKRLEKYTGVKYRRNVLGEWVQADGVVFDRWDSSLGVISRDQLKNSERFKNHHLWRRIWSVDFGYSHPFVWQDWAIDEDGNMLLIKEIYKTGIIVEDAARMILEVTAGEPKPFAIVCDHDREDRATLERHLGMPTIPAIKDVQVGIDAVQSRMTPAGNGRPRLMIYEHSLVHSPDEALDDRASSTIGSIDAYVWKKNIDGTITKDEVVKEEDDGCFVSGTMVDTPFGSVPIEQMQVGDMVKTHLGVSQVAASGMTGIRDTIRVHLENGTTLECTKAHPLAVHGGGWVEAGDSHGRIIDTRRENPCKYSPFKREAEGQPKKYFGMASGGDDTLTGKTFTSGDLKDVAESSRHSGFISKYGYFIAGQFRKAWSFITATRTLPTTLSKIWSARLQPTTRRFISAICKRRSSLQSRGILHQKAGFGIPTTQKLFFDLLNRNPSPANYAANVIAQKNSRRDDSVQTHAALRFEEKQEPTTRIVRASFASELSPATVTQRRNAARKNVAASRVVRIEKGSRKSEVYNLSTDDGTYFANGVLVSNCDAMRYCVMHLDHRPAEPDAGNYSAPPTDTTMHDIFGSTEAIRWV